MDKYIVFDFDGTITNVAKVAPKVAEDVFSQLNMEVPRGDELMQYRELTIPEAIRKIKMPLHKVPKAIALTRKSLHARADEIEPIDGIEAVLRSLHDDETVKGVYILTSNTNDFVEAFLNKHGLREYFTEINGGLNLFNKPNKLKALLKRHNIPKREAVMVGDEMRDMEAGKKAGIKNVAVTWGIGSKRRLTKSKPHAIVSSAEQLNKVLH